MKVFFIVILLATCIVISLSFAEKKIGVDPDPIRTKEPVPLPSNTPINLLPTPEPEKRKPGKGNEDLDGDGINDEISFDFTGGAHCCYNLEIALSKSKKGQKFPFNMDGGYEMGVIYEPDHFDVRDIDGDGRAEILMRIETYNSEISPIPKAWRRRYGFKTNFIVIEYERGKLQVRDQDSYGKLIPPVGWRKELLENKEQ